jgi:hypothetical protein
VYQSALNIPDCHIPWHDKKAYGIMLDVASDHHERLGLTEINIMGDFLDFFWCSLHPKLPGAMTLKETVQSEIAEGCKALEELRKRFPGVKINFIEGNHEQRLQRWIVKKCPELWDLEELTLPYLLKFKDHDINYVPFGKCQLYRCLGTDYILRHQPFNQGKHCAASSIANKHTCLGFGHTHRRQSFSETDAFGNEIFANSLGWLGDSSAPVFDYMDTDHWVQGFEIVHALDGKIVQNDYISIRKGKAIYNGVLYEG